jgi:hypothetical protein
LVFLIGIGIVVIQSRRILEPALARRSQRSRIRIDPGEDSECNYTCYENDDRDKLDTIICDYKTFNYRGIIAVILLLIIATYGLLHYGVGNAWGVFISTILPLFRDIFVGIISGVGSTLVIKKYCK